jgi:hypothetical protein
MPEHQPPLMSPEAVAAAKSLVNLVYDCCPWLRPTGHPDPLTDAECDAMLREWIAGWLKHHPRTDGLSSLPSRHANP